VTEPLAEIDEPTRAGVLAELTRLRKEAQEFTVAQIRAGEWFSHLLVKALSSYSRTVDAEYFQTKYPGLNRDAIADRRIDLAQRYAALAGGLSAAGYSAAVVATLGSHGGASPVTVPAAITALMADLFLISRLQLRLAYDLSVLYEHPIDMDDPEDLLALVRVAFGVKAGEQLQNAATKLAPEATRVAAKTLFQGSALHSIKGLPVVGKYLLQRNIIKMAIPGVAIPLSSGVNYFMTGRIAKTARQIFRDRALALELADGIMSSDPDDPALLLQVVWLVMRADGKTTAEEAGLLNALAIWSVDAENADPVEALDTSFQEMVDLDEGKLLERLSTATPETQQLIWEAACVAAVIDHKLHRKEEKQLRRIAAACGIDYEREALDQLKDRFR
jgi:hypothetical protein